MAPPSLTYILDNVGTSTIEKRLQGLIDGFYKSNPLAMRLLQQDRILADGGKDVRQRIIYTRKPGGSYAGSDTFDTSKKESRTEMVFNWKQYYVDISLDGIDLLKNAGESQISDLVQDEMDEAQMTAPDLIGDDVFLDGTGNGGKAITGLRAAFDDGTTYTTYGGITRSSTANTPGKAVSGNVTTTATTFSLSQMNTFMGTATISNHKPNLIITTQALWNKWWERAQPAQRFGPGDARGALAAVGFSSIEFNGAEVVVDGHCPSGNIFFINTNFVKMVIHSKRMWEPTGWKYPTNSDQAIQQLLWAGELVVQSPRLQNLATNVS